MTAVSPLSADVAEMRAAALEAENARLRAELAERDVFGSALRSIADAMPVLISYVDADQRFRFANAAYTVRFGRPLSEIIGFTLREVMGEAVYEDRRPYVQRALGGEAVRYEVDLPHETGVLHTLVEHIPDRDAAGRVRGFYALVQDVTGPRREQRRQAFLSSLSDSLRDIADPLDVISRAEEALGRHLGVDRVGFGETGVDDADFIVQRNWTSDGTPSLAGLHRLTAFGPDLLPVLRAGKPWVLEDARTDPRTRDPETLAAYEVLGAMAVVTASLVKDGRLVAALYVHNREARRWSPTDLDLIAETAERTWSAVERARAEAARREGEAKLRALTDNLPNAMVYQMATSRDLTSRRYTYVSASCERLTGVTAGEALADPASLADIVGPEQRADVSAAELHAAQTLVPLELEVSGRTRDGRLLRSRLISQPRSAVDGGLLWDGIVIDVTERHLAAGALDESEDRFRRIADSAPVPMWVTGLDRRRVFCNAAYVEFLGVAYDEALTYDWRNILHPEDAARIYAEQRDKEASLRPFSLEARYRRADGQWRWLRSESQPRWGPDGRHVGFIGAAFDITEAKQAQADLQRINDLLEARVAERTAELRDLYNKAPIPLHSQSPEGVLIAVSDRWLELMGYDHRDQVLGRRASEFLTPESRRRLEINWPILLDRGWMDDVEYQIVKRSGEIADVLVSTRIARDAEGQFVRTMGAVVDVTARKRAEDQLRQAQKMEAMGQLTGGVAHDFNNLLTPVIGSLDLLRGRLKGDPRTDRLLEGAMQGAERAATLVQRLLAFARRQGLNPEPTDVGRLVGGLHDLISRSIGPQIAVQVSIPADLPPVLVDPNQLELALLNLAVNARDAMPDGGVLRIEAEAALVGTDARSRLTTGRYVRLTVIDTGVGMDEATLRRAVEPFFSTKSIGKGTGLGLSMVHGLAAQSGGALELFSRPGEGVRAELWLPISDRHAGSAGDEPAVYGPVIRPCKVLLVDDEALVRSTVGDMLRALGCEVFEAASGEEALEHVRHSPALEVLVTDHLMPGMRGGDLARTVREFRPDIRLLLITGYADAADQIDASLPRLNKPFRKEELARALERVLSIEAVRPV